MKITVVGTGYVGLVTGTCLAETGNDVICVDIDEQKVSSMKKGIIPIYEPGLEVVFHRNIKEKRLEFTTDLEYAVSNSDLVFLALPTPPGDDGSADLSYILGVADKLGPILKGYTVIINKSTVPVGTASRVHAALEANTSADFDVVSNPEFLREGYAVKDFMEPDRIVIGTKSKKAQKVMSELYSPFVEKGSKIFFMDEKSSEMTKYAANSFLATKISFMNEIANISELVGADVDMIRLGIGADERIGSRFLFPGIGYGGSCFPKDVMALNHTADEYGYSFKILDAVMNVNKIQKTILVDKIKKYYNNVIKGKEFSIWGLAFKPDTDDIREAPALEIIKALIDEGAKVKVYDPEAMENVKKYFKESKCINYFDDPYKALKNTDALIILTEWAEFMSPDFSKIKNSLIEPVIFDGRNLYEIGIMRNKGFHYESIGRGIVE